MRPDGTFTEYNHLVCNNAIADFINKLPNKENDYYEAIGSFTQSLYEKQSSGGEKYFLEKTPRYYLILDVIEKIFPDAKFVFLFRNPIQVMASVIETWAKGRLRLENLYIDLYKGPEKLAEGYKRLKNKSVAVFYDDLLQKPEENLKRIFEYLELEYSCSILKQINKVSIDGKMGDKTGYYEYETIETTVTEKWKKTFNTGFRKRIAKKYIQKLSPETLDAFGLSHAELESAIDAVKTSRWMLFTDLFNLTAGKIIRLFEVPMFLKKFRRRLEKADLYFIHR